jgi:hypothetical protein
MIGNARCHCRRNARRLVNAGKIVMHHVQRDRVSLVLDLLWEGVCQPLRQWTAKTIARRKTQQTTASRRKKL